MKKIIAKLLLFLIILKIFSPISFIGEVFAVSNSWDFSNSDDYTLSDTDINHIKIENSLVRLPYHLEHLGAITDDSLDGARNVIVKGNYAFVSANTADKLLSIDISDPTNPTIAFILSDGDQGIDLDSPRGLTYTGNYLYVAGRVSDNVNIIDISDPTNLVFVKEIADSRTEQQLNGANDVQINGNYLYVTAHNDDALNIFDISDPSNPSYIKNLKDSNRLDGANSVKISGNYAYVTADNNDSLEIIDLTNQDSESTNISIVGELTDGGGDSPYLDGAQNLNLSGSLAYISSNISDALEIVDISDPTNPIHTGSILNGGDVKLNANRSNILYNGFSFNTARSSDAVEVVDISAPNNPKHESNIVKSSDVLLDGATDIYNSGSLFYVASNVSDALEILKVKYLNNSPYVIPNNYYSYTGAIASLSQNLGTYNSGTITYQISKDNGNTWYFYNGNSWQATNSGVVESNSLEEINNNIGGFNYLDGDKKFLFKAFLNSNGEQKVELDQVNLETIDDSEKPNISGSNISSGSILPGANHSIEFNYTDSGGSDIYTSGDNFVLEKWDSSNSSWIDVSSNIQTETITNTKASYLLENLDFGKYRASFDILDNAGNKSDTFGTTFYIDRPSLTISTGSIDIGNLNSNSNTFGDTLTVTVKTIGAAFRVKLKKNQILTHSNSNDFIPYYDGTLGMGYDKNDDGNLSDFNDDIILSDSGSLNTDGNLNTYTYTLKIGAIIDKLQASGDYSGKIDFGIELDY